MQRRSKPGFIAAILPTNSLLFIDHSCVLVSTQLKFFSFFLRSVVIAVLNIDSDSMVIIKNPPFLFLALFKSQLFLSFYEFTAKQHSRLANSINKLINQTAFGSYNIIQLVGFRYQQRWFRVSQVLRYKFGYNKKVWFKCPEDFVCSIRKISPKKRTHFFFSYDQTSLRRLSILIHSAKPSSLYRGRGVNIKEQPMVLKEGKKSQW